MTGNPMYALQDVPGKGKGLVAIEKIPKGTRILSEKPIIAMSRYVVSDEPAQLSISKQVAALTERQRQAFLAMHNIHPYKNDAEQYHGIFQTNCLPAEMDEDMRAIFLEACRINHACDNNAQKNWNGRLALQKRFGFECSCTLCSLPLGKSKESDKRLDELLNLDRVIDQLGTEGIIKSPLKALGYFDQQVRLYYEQGEVAVNLAQTLVHAAWLVIANGDLARGRIFSERAATVWKTALGSDSKQVLDCRILALNPSTYELYGVSNLWKTTVDEIASGGLESNDFEDWLWRREKARPLGQLAGLRSCANFPAFIDLPNENDIGFDFYGRSDNYQPRRHWCFLGEIVDFTSLTRLGMEVKDVSERKIPIWFYTYGRGTELASAEVKKGNTIAILYARQHKFLYCEAGIRHENPGLMKIFPSSLSNLLALSDKVQQFSIELDGTKPCHGCGKKGTSRQCCSKCLSFWYCSKACQVARWKEKGHKADCKLLQDPDLRGLFVVKWDKFDGYMRFPLQLQRDA
ncbi:hypothetical protein ACJ72_00672 [Emergomyces africanus]|uniref:MYND-type domain-containing protein n=1 Tax=Emergomyces africanus TaxID=1955775 RepID=A0A1B7P7S3_9EURO|nr:hypothetical protein ACJ72_00672 [Emergomyces africanus]